MLYLTLFPNDLLLLPALCVFVGESTSGKTAICNAFTSEGYSFSRNYHMVRKINKGTRNKNDMI